MLKCAHKIITIFVCLNNHFNVKTLRNYLLGFSLTENLGYTLFLRLVILFYSIWKCILKPRDTNVSYYMISLVWGERHVVSFKYVLFIHIYASLNIFIFIQVIQKFLWMKVFLIKETNQIYVILMIMMMTDEKYRIHHALEFLHLKAQRCKNYLYEFYFETKILYFIS